MNSEKANARFDVQQWLAENRSVKETQVSQPVLVGQGWTKHSRKDGGGYSFENSSGLQAFTKPKLPLDLNAGREQYVSKNAGDKGDVETVVQAVHAASARVSDCDVLTFRNNLNKIFGTPLDLQSGWAVDACWQDGVLYLDIIQQEQQWRGDPAGQEKFTYWGYSFEAACTGQGVVDASAEYAALIKTSIGGLRILLGAEIDCYDPRTGVGVCGTQPPKLRDFLELKTYKLPHHPKQQYNLHRYKHPKWWLQSFLAGVPTLALGGRDDQGIVHQIDLVPTFDLHKISQGSGAFWDPLQSLKFGVDCLKWMQCYAVAHTCQHIQFTYESRAKSINADVVLNGNLPARLRSLHNQTNI